MSAALDRPRLSTEAVSRARDFRRRLEAEDASWLAALKSALRPLHERCERHPQRPLRSEHLGALAERWRFHAPQRFRISCTVQLGGVHGTITERRLGIGRLDDDLAEPGCSVVEMRFVADRDGVRRSALILTTFSLHAIATRFARGQNIEDAAVIADLAVVAAVEVEKLGPAGGGVRIGHWRGRLATIADADGGRRRIVCIGTWLAEER